MPVHKVGSVIGPWQWLQNQEGQSYFFNSDTKVLLEHSCDDGTLFAFTSTTTPNDDK
jgi:hypothetical protein